MINRQMEKMKIYQYVNIKDELGFPKDEWELVEESYIAINFVSVQEIKDVLRYKDVTNTGLTRYKYLNNKDKFKVETDTTTYEVINVNNIPRLSVVYLKEV